MIDDLFAEGARVMWVAPHPDDEFLSGAILARASVHHEVPLCMVVLTRGEGGESALAGGEDLGQLRMQEAARAAERYQAELVQGHFWNAPLPVSTFPDRVGVYDRWREDLDPVLFVQRAIERFLPDVLLTFDPHHGATGHPEHQAASRVATEAVVRAGERHRVSHVFHVLKQHWAFRLFRDADPGPRHETFDALLPCADHGTCLDFQCEATKIHQTQDKDMRAFRRFRRLFRAPGLRQVDPWTERFPPDE